MALRPVLIPYNDASSAEGDALFLLSESTRSMILALSGANYWSTRWFDELSGTQEFTDEQKAVIVSLAQKLEKEVLTPMEICAEIIACITDNEGTQEAINDLVDAAIENNTYLTKQLINIFNNRQPITTEDCRDGLFACIRQTLNFIDVHTLDWLEKVDNSAAANSNELINAFAGITGANSAGVSIITAFVNWIVDNLLDAYPAIATQEKIDEVACEIFCQYSEQCDISIDDLYQFFKAKVDEVYPTDTGTLLTYLGDVVGIVSGITDDLVFNVMMRNYLEIVRHGNLALDAATSINSRAFQARFNAYCNDVDGDWELLCSCGSTEKTMRAYGRGYSVNGGDIIVVNSTSDAFYTYTCNVGDEITLVCNGTAVASGDWEGNALQTITITYLSLAGGSYTEQYQNLTGTPLGAWTVGSTITDAQANAFGLSAMSFTVDA